MTPEAEARYALSYSVPREQISAAAQPHFDRLRADIAAGRLSSAYAGANNDQHRNQRTDWRPAVIVISGMLWVAFLILQFAPVYHGYSVPKANQLCSSTLGLLAQGLSQHAAQLCTSVGYWMDGKAIALVLALAGTAAVIFESVRRSSPRQVAPGQ